MAHAKDKRPHEISGGMKQRVGIARALAMEPKVLLLDEPFGALDALTRAHLQDSVMEIHATLGNTVMMITHDVDEAVLLSDRIVMMTNGPAARIGEVLDVALPRPRERPGAGRGPDLRPRAAPRCCASSTRATPSRRRPRDAAERSGHRRRRHGGGAAGATSSPAAAPGRFAITRGRRGAAARPMTASCSRRCWPARRRTR